MNIKISGGSNETEQDSSDDDVAANTSLDDFEIIANNDTANLKQVKTAELIRRKDLHSSVEVEDDIRKMTEISEKYAKSYADNFNGKDVTYEKELKKLQEQIKMQEDQLNQLRTRQQQYGLVLPPQYGFQYPLQQHLNQVQYPFQLLNNNSLQAHFQHQVQQAFQPALQPTLEQAYPSTVQQPLRSPIQQKSVNQKDEDEIKFEMKVRIASQTSCSDKNFAVKLLQLYFTKEELSIDELNVNGKNMRGQKVNKIALDQTKVEFIKERVMNRVNGDEKIKKIIWNQCVSAMNKKIREIKCK